MPQYNQALSERMIRWAIQHGRRVYAFTCGRCHLVALAPVPSVDGDLCHACEIDPPGGPLLAPLCCPRCGRPAAMLSEDACGQCWEDLQRAAGVAW